MSDFVESSYRSEASPINREDAFVLYCARTIVDADAAGRIAALMDGNLDWLRVAQQVVHHRVTPLVYRALNGLPPSNVPRTILRRLAQRCSAIARRNLFLSGEMVRIGRLLDDLGVEFIAYKGPVLAILAYGDVAMREFGDLDILVDKNDYAIVRGWFLQGGYRLANDWGWECSIVDDSRHVSIDLHKRLAPAEFPLSVDFRRLSLGRTDVPILGRSIRTLSPEDMLIVLCVQLVKDSWGVGRLRLSKLCDIAEMLRSGQRLDWARIVSDASRSGVVRIVATGIDAAHKLLGAPIPYQAPLLRDKAVAGAIIGHVAARLFQGATAGTTARLPQHHFHSLVRERWRDRLYPRWFAIQERLARAGRDSADSPSPSPLLGNNASTGPTGSRREYAVTVLRSLKGWWMGRGR